MSGLYPSKGGGILESGRARYLTRNVGFAKRGFSAPSASRPLTTCR